MGERPRGEGEREGVRERALKGLVIVVSGGVDIFAENGNTQGVVSSLRSFEKKILLKWEEIR